MFIDIHVHTLMCPAAPRFYHGDNMTFAGPEALIAGYDAVGIEQAVLLPVVNPECAYTVQSNEEILAICEKYPGRFIPFCNIDPRFIANHWQAPLGDLIKYYRDKGCRGVGEVAANLPFLHPLAQNLFKGAEEAGVPLTFHISPYVGYSYGLVDDPGLPQLELCLRRFPKLRFFGHSQTFWAEISASPTLAERVGYPKGKVLEGRVVELMRQYPNLYGDLSAGSGRNALTRDRDFAAKFLTEFQDRLFFGTDICQPTMPTLRPLAEFLLDLRGSGEIDEAVFRKVARENAVRELGLNNAADAKGNVEK